MAEFEPRDPKEQDPSKPLPGESFSDYWKRLQREETEKEQQQNYGEQEYWNGLRDYGHGTTGDPNFGPIPEEYQANGMSKAAFACGLLALITIFFNGSLFFGALGLIFALLSRKKKLGKQAKIAIWMNTAGIVAFVVAIAISIGTLIRTGIWDKMLTMVQNMDPNDPYALSEIQSELLEDILESYGLDYPRLTGSSAGSGISSTSL